MSGLNLENLENNRDEILKAELLSLMALWDKVNPEIGPNKNVNINISFKNLDCLKDYLQDKKLKILGKEFDTWEDFLNNWRSWGKQNDLQKVLQIFYGIGESLNSGIDKGSPKKDVKVKSEGKRWLANAYGGFKSFIYYLSEDESVVNKTIDDIRNTFNTLIGSSTLRWENVKAFELKLQLLLSNLLSDDRFPINDVSLWDQSYMAASMYKATLAEAVLRGNLSINARNQKNWRILGIQYDKLGLAEKGYKPSQIQWYRETAREIDEEIKKLLEYKYPIGNEIYRDETGIYFLVGEDLGEDLPNSTLAELHPDLGEVRREILKIFKDKSYNEFYPAIFLTKPSRGLMNLTYLLEKAKDNFLKTDWSIKEVDVCLEKSKSGRAIVICQVCKQRLVFKSDRRDVDKNICDICYEKKTQGRIDKWLRNRDGETIWMDELRDKNDRVALLTLKFELSDWLNGNLLNSLIIREEDYEKNISGIKSFILLFLSQCDINKYFDVKKIDEKIRELEKKLRNSQISKAEKQQLGFQKKKHVDVKKIIEDIAKVVTEIRNNIWWEKPLKDKSITSKYQNSIEELWKDIIKAKYEGIKTDFNIPLIDNFTFFPEELAPDAYGGCKNNDESFNDFIDQIFFGSIIRTPWEEWIKATSLNEKIDWQNRKIKWVEFKDEKDPALDVLSSLLFQFLLRKNPSPARLRRIWGTTKEFFEEIERKICAYAGISEERRKRYYWENINLEKGEYVDGEAVFWSDGQNVYLISYLPDVEKLMKQEDGDNNPKEKVFVLKKYLDRKDTGKELKLSHTDEKQGKVKSEFYIPYMSIIDPTPISWQFAIPAEYVPDLIDSVMEKYNEHFKFVYGKLPLHIGVVIQDYKKPLYIGINALRRIRRDVENKEKLKISIKARDIKDKLNFPKNEERINKTCNYYSLYWGTHTQGYEFYVKPKEYLKKWVCNIENIGESEDICIVPNTFDFEFLNTNLRRNEIYYDEENAKEWKENKGVKRKIFIKSGRPYNIEKYWEKFKNFKELFGQRETQDAMRKSRLLKLVSVIYDKMDNKEDMKTYIASSFINILNLNKDLKLRNGIAEIFGISINEENFHSVLKDSMTQENLKLFLDMFDFWHNALKEV
ncbi:CRISPR-associated protein Csx11 [Thermoanaerobacterium thermosaccharolyticum]|uniref:CRISPR-associated protein Csx11 n=1 Tax=Thermoanaerobacterium thermosaccharolyticum TaxID=1517 RepID=UPI003DA9D2D6